MRQGELTGLTEEARKRVEDTDAAIEPCYCHKRERSVGMGRCWAF